MKMGNRNFQEYTLDSYEVSKENNEMEKNVKIKINEQEELFKNESSSTKKNEFLNQGKFFI